MENTTLERLNGCNTTAADPDPQQLQSVEVLTGELKQILERNNNTFDDETIQRQMEIMERWLDCYRRHFVTTDTFSETSAALLKDLRARLKLAAEELQRLEGEGGNPASKEQVAQNEELIKAIRRNEKLLSDIEALLPAHHHQ